MSNSYLKYCVYPVDLPAGIPSEQLPGLVIERILREMPPDSDDTSRLNQKLQHSCRKLCMMCLAAERAIRAEREFYSTTIQDSPVLFGKDAVEIAYHLEGFIFFARSSLDIASSVFGYFLFNKRRFDSFNDLCKTIIKNAGGEEKILKELVAEASSRNGFSLASHILLRQNEEYSWLSTLCGSERGRALRDKIAHQTGFPIDYEELRVDSEKENAVVTLSASMQVPLVRFIETVRDGIVENFNIFEENIRDFCLLKN